MFAVILALVSTVVCTLLIGTIGKIVQVASTSQDATRPINPILNGVLTTALAIWSVGAIGYAVGSLWDMHALAAAHQAVVPSHPGHPGHPFVAPHPNVWMVAIAFAIFGALFGIEASLVEGYVTSSPLLIWLLFLDLTWSLTNTVLGFIWQIGFLFLGLPDAGLSRGKSWIAYSSGASVLETIGPFNSGGAGKHEPVHLVQARIFGPLFIPLVLGNYVINGIIQIVYTSTLGWILKLAGVAQHAYLIPPVGSAVGGKPDSSTAAKFFGWIYASTLMELWAYATQAKST